MHQHCDFDRTVELLFGRTGLQVSQIVFGGGWVGGVRIHQDDETKLLALRRAMPAQWRGHDFGDLLAACRVQNMGTMAIRVCVAGAAKGLLPREALEKLEALYLGNFPL